MPQTTRHDEAAAECILRFVRQGAVGMKYMNEQDLRRGRGARFQDDEIATALVGLNDRGWVIAHGKGRLGKHDTVSLDSLHIPEALTFALQHLDADGARLLRDSPMFQKWGDKVGDSYHEGLPSTPASVEEVEAMLAPYATKRDIATLTKNIASRHDLDALRVEVGQRLKQVQPDTNLRAEVEQAMQKALTRLQKVEGAEARVQALEDWKRGAVDVLKRVKDLGKNGARDPRVVGLIERMEEHDRMLETMDEAFGSINNAVMFMDKLRRQYETKGLVVIQRVKGEPMWFDPDSPGIVERDEEGHVVDVVAPAGAEIEGEPLPLNGEEKPHVQRPLEVPEECTIARMFVADGAHRLRLNRYEAASWMVEHLGVPEWYASGLITVGLHEGWLETRKAPAEGQGGAGQPKKVLNGIAREQEWMHRNGRGMPAYQKMLGLVNRTINKGVRA